MIKVTRRDTSDRKPPSLKVILMRSFRESLPSSVPDLSVALPLATTLSIGLATVPLLAVLAAGRLIGEQAIELGKASEELFRGDRLPSRPLLDD